MVLKTVLNLDFELMFMENIITKYIQYPDNGVYVVGNRYSLEDRSLIEKYSKLKKLYNTPQHPIYSAELLLRIGYLLAYDSNPCRDIIRSNPLVNNGFNTKELYPCPPRGIMSIQDIITDFIPEITHNDYIELSKYVDIVSNKFMEVFDTSPNAVYRIDIDSNQFKIFVGEDVSKLRYYEALESRNECSHE